MRKKFIAGNWKMNMTPTEAKALTDLLKNECNQDKTDVVFCVPFIDIQVVKENLKGTSIEVGAQNFYFEDKGAYTGEISADMLLDAGVQYVIIGHSERRKIFNEDDLFVNKKVVKALSKGLKPILCVGETLSCRENGETLSFVEKQVQCALSDVSNSDIVNVIIAYEPIWAIGTGKTATSDEAEDVCSHIRNMIKNLYDKNVSENIRILYGGSMNSKNAAELLSKTDIDGGLIGGASLKSEFNDIVKLSM